MTSSRRSCGTYDAPRLSSAQNSQVKGGSQGARDTCKHVVRVLRKLVNQ